MVRKPIVYKRQPATLYYCILNYHDSKTVFYNHLKNCAQTNCQFLKTNRLYYLLTVAYANLEIEIGDN